MEYHILLSDTMTVPLYRYHPFCKDKKNKQNNANNAYILLIYSVISTSQLLKKKYLNQKK